MNSPPLPRRVAFLGDHPPRLCGIATFTHDLCEALAQARPQTDCFVVAVNDRREGYPYPPRVRFEIAEEQLESYRQAADYLNLKGVDLLCVQHEFGIYGGPAGSHLLALLEEARMPVVTTLHTVLQSPSAVQRSVMEKLITLSDRLVVMAHKGAEILKRTYGVDPGKLDVIPHGIPDVPFSESDAFKAQFGVESRDVLLTFGLIGPGKGIEHAIEALPEIARKHPNAVYLILGATHPQLLAREGERYRLGLKRQADVLGVKGHVIFHNRFVSLEDLKDFIGATDIYLTPYLNEEQVTSGTLAYVFGAGKAVVSTPYWHAQELLDKGRGILVPFSDPPAIAHAVCQLLSNKPQMEKIRREAYAIGRDMIWPAVAQQYLNTFETASAERKITPRAAVAGWTLDSRPQALPPLRLNHVFRMSDATGIFQHAIFNVPNFHEGYCTDDNARAYLLCALLDDLGDRPSSRRLNRLATTYLAFLAAALDKKSGRFRNFMSHSREWLEDAGSEDSHGRALWSLGTGAARSSDGGHRALSAQLFHAGLPAVETFTSPRAWAFTLIGIHEYLRRCPGERDLHATRAALTNKLLSLWQDSSSDAWPWFENGLSYENARLSQALLCSGQAIPHPEALAVGLESLRWLASIQTSSRGFYRPVGSNGFYTRGGRRAEFDQQPVEAQAMVSACREAYRATGDRQWQGETNRSFEWFLGRNDLGQSLYDFTTGGCSDGLHEDRISENQGAESTLAFHLALAEMRLAQQWITPTHSASPAPTSP